jgi:hypothetical protein
MSEDKIIELTNYSREEEVHKIQVTKNQILFFSPKDEIIHVIALDSLPDFSNDQALNIHLHAKVLIDR